MSLKIPGLHHVTAISGPPQANVDFYIATLLQRLVKKTVNFDDPGTYHLYYGNQQAEPGTILTFFPFDDAGPGRAGPGMARAFAYAVPQGGLNTWMMALAEADVPFDGPTERFSEQMITLTDPDGLRVELIETTRGTGLAANGDTPVDDGLHSVTLWLKQPDRTARAADGPVRLFQHGRDLRGWRNAPPLSCRGSRARLGHRPVDLRRTVHRAPRRGHDPSRRFSRARR